MGTKLAGDHLSMGTEFLGGICPWGPNWLGTVCPEGPINWGPIVGDQMSGVPMRLGPNVFQPNILCGIYNYAKGNFKPKISYIFHFECIKVV
jgi:hypothetical protein